MLFEVAAFTSEGVLHFGGLRGQGSIIVSLIVPPHLQGILASDFVAMTNNNSLLKRFSYLVLSSEICEARFVRVNKRWSLKP